MAASPRTRRQLGPYSRTLQRGAIGSIAVDGRSERGRFIRALEKELVEHVGGKPSIAQRLLIDNIVRQRLQLDLLGERLASGANWTPHDGRTFAALQNSFRLSLRELGLEPTKPKPATITEIMAARQRGEAP